MDKDRSEYIVTLRLHTLSKYCDSYSKKVGWLSRMLVAVRPITSLTLRSTDAELGLVHIVLDLHQAECHPILATRAIVWLQMQLGTIRDHMKCNINVFYALGRGLSVGRGRVLIL